MTGDHAAAEGGMAAGCMFFAGYPITPSTEIAERMSARLPQVGGIYIQMEDELASMNAILGAAWGGWKSMTCTSGPGFSLMMENLGLGIVLETPTVLVNIQRGGPSTGLPTLVGQADMMQAKWGSHGDYEIIALCPNSPQEVFDLTVKAFNLAEQYRMPVLVMGDESVGHMSEKVVIPPADKLNIYPRRYTKKKPGQYKPYEWGKDNVPDMVKAGDGYRFHVTGLTHDERGYPIIDAKTQEWMVRHLIDKIQKNKDKIIEVEELNMDDADVVIVSYGISSRVSYRAMDLARAEGLKVGMLRLITAWPFCEEKIKELAGRVKALVTVEINYGQMSLEVERCAAGKAATYLVPHGGGDIHDPADILEVLKEAAK
ncbi:MAG: 2-oxoacid:acceptor oxidoreductase subunit alpha [Candidatus Eisenbacteria bacterium]